ncbi:hypothetical protein CBM2633_B60042 [Cupriavidus taiwanensis]|nr:hypothetical protein CBM2633_B60042 [Cupriavidus taiwanensis]
MFDAYPRLQDSERRWRLWAGIEQSSREETAGDPGGMHTTRPPRQTDSIAPLPTGCPVGIAAKKNVLITYPLF